MLISNKLWTGYIVDIWKPTITITDDREVLTAAYELLYSSVPTNRHEVNQQKKIKLGLNVSWDFANFYFGPNTLLELKQFYILVNKRTDENTYWLVYNTPIHWNNEAPLGEYWKAITQNLTTVPSEIGNSYAP